MKTRALIALQIAGALLLVSGVAGLVYWQRTPPIMLQHSDPHLQVRNRSAMDALTGFIHTSPGQLLAISPYAQNVKTIPRPNIPHTGLWIEMPALDIALPIKAGNAPSNIPQWVALTYPGTIAPGSPGNSYIYAHGLWGMFGSLLFARVGDQVLLHNYDTKSIQTLHVTQVVGRVRYNDNRWLRATSAKPLLTLQTCIDFNPKGDRFIVLAS
jgi:LPXTG-site transpeptidase (sortase) family protein